MNFFGLRFKQQHRGLRASDDPSLGWYRPISPDSIIVSACKAPSSLRTSSRAGSTGDEALPKIKPILESPLNAVDDEPTSQKQSPEFRIDDHPAS